jgi:cysteine desulfurase
LRSGTENTPAIVGFAAALKDAGRTRQYEAERLGELQHKLQDGLQKLGCIIVAHSSLRSEAIICALIPRLDSETAVYKLDKLGVYISSGSACHAKTGEKSHVLGSIGLSDVDAMSAIRISLGRGTSDSGIRLLLKSLKEVLA